MSAHHALAHATEPVRAPRRAAAAASTGLIGMTMITVTTCLVRPVVFV